MIAEANIRTMELPALWQSYQETRAENVRNELVVRYDHVVRHWAARIHSKLPPLIQYDDLYSTGILGLMEAISNFDLNRGIKFETYAGPRVRGAILDNIRDSDWVPRLVRSRHNQITAVASQLFSALGRSPTRDELRHHMGMEEMEFNKVIDDSEAPTTRSIDDPFALTGKSDPYARERLVKDSLADPSQGPFESLSRLDFIKLAINGFSRAEKLIIVLYYYEDMTMREIGITLDLSESRVSQMHSSLLARLKAKMTERQKSFC